MKIRVLTAPFIVLALTSVAGTSSAQMPKMPKLPGISASPSAATLDPSSAQLQFFGKFTQARVEIGAAQMYLAKAFELKDQVALLEAEQATLKSGSLDGDGIKKAKELSESVNEALAAKMAENAQLSEEGRSNFTASMPHLLQGTLLATKLPAEAQAFADTAQGALTSASLAEKVKFAGMAKAAAALATEVPGFTKSTVGAYKQTVAYGRSNKIPMPKDATDALGAL